MPLEPERRTDLIEDVRQRTTPGRGAGECRQGAGLGTRPAGTDPVAPDTIDEHGHDARRRDVDEEGQHVLGIRDVESVERRREVPVGQQQAAGSTPPTSATVMARTR